MFRPALTHLVLIKQHLNNSLTQLSNNLRRSQNSCLIWPLPLSKCSSQITVEEFSKINMVACKTTMEV